MLNNTSTHTTQTQRAAHVTLPKTWYCKPYLQFTGFSVFFCFFFEKSVLRELDISAHLQHSVSITPLPHHSRYTPHVYCPDRPCHALPCPALPCPALPCPALPCPALPCPAMPCPTLPCPALPCPALPCPAMPCSALPYPALPCPAMPCPALPCPALPCSALPCPAIGCCWGPVGWYVLSGAWDAHQTLKGATRASRLAPVPQRASRTYRHLFRTRDHRTRAHIACHHRSPEHTAPRNRGIAPRVEDTGDAGLGRGALCRGNNGVVVVYRGPVDISDRGLRRGGTRRSVPAGEAPPPPAKEC